MVVLKWAKGFTTKIGQIAANEFGLDLDMIEVTATRTDKVPNTSPTAASSGTDLNGKAVQNACITLKARLAECFAKSLGLEDRAGDVLFINEHVVLDEHKLPLPSLCSKRILLVYLCLQAVSIKPQNYSTTATPVKVVRFSILPMASQ